MAIAWIYREDYARAATWSCPKGRKNRLSPGKPYFHPWHFSQWSLVPAFEVSLESFILQRSCSWTPFLCYRRALLLANVFRFCKAVLFASILYLPLCLLFFALDKK